VWAEGENGVECRGGALFVGRLFGGGFEWVAGAFEEVCGGGEVHLLAQLSIV